MVKRDFFQFSVKDFILDESFQRWVSNADSSPSAEWKEWLEEYPERRSVVANAKSFIALLRASLDEVVALEVAEESWSSVEGKLALV